MVMLDGEDAIAPGDAVAQRALAVAADTFADADWGTATATPSLRFYRPPGFAIDTTVRDLSTLLWRLRERTDDPAAFPLDGIVMPKLEHPEEVDLVHELLDRAEADLGLVPGRLRVGLPHRGGLGGGPAAGARPACRAAAGRAHLRHRRLQRRPRAAGHRHGPPAGGLGPGRDDRHGRCRGRARHRRHDPRLPGQPIRPWMPPPTAARWLERMRLVYDDTVTARDLGMTGKWVGHPAQLFAVLLAFEAGQSDARPGGRGPEAGGLPGRP